MLVKPIKLGYYAHGNEPMNHVLRYPAEYSHKANAGAPFHLEKPEHFSARWMEVVEATDEEMVIVNAKTEQTQDAIRKGAVPVTMNAFGAPPPAPGVKIRGTDNYKKPKKKGKRAPEPESHNDEEVSE